MRKGRFIAVVGPSGVGKDSVMAGLQGRDAAFKIQRRAITRAPELGEEDFIPLSETAFRAARARGIFVLHWGAHGLFYGIPQTVRSDIDIGRDMLVNLSRAVLREAQHLFPTLVVLHLTATPETLAARLAGRGRESAADIAARLARTGKPLPDDLPCITVSNDGALDETIDTAFVALRAAAQAERG